MKGILEFDLPEDKDDFKVYQKAYDYKFAWDGIWAWIKSQTKHTDRETLTFDELRDALVEIQNEHEID